MKSLLTTFSIFVFVFLMSFKPNDQEFQGQAFYFSKSKMELGNWGARMSEAQKKQVQERLKNRLEKNLCFKFQQGGVCIQ